MGELRLLGEAAELGPDAETRRDELLVELARSGRWSNGQLARAARLSGSLVRRLLNEGGVAQQGRGVELGRRNGSRLGELRAIEDVPAGPAGAPVRARRDLLLVEVWETDPASWTLPRPAWAAGMTPMVAAEAVRSHRQLTGVTTSTPARPEAAGDRVLGRPGGAIPAGGRRLG